MKKIVLMLVVGIVFFSGCTQTSSKKSVQVIKGSYGVAINEFSSYVSEFKPGESTTLYFKITNIGNVTSDKVSLRLINYGDLSVEDEEYYNVGSLEPEDDFEYSWTVEAPNTEGVVYFPAVQLCYDYSSVGYKSIKIIDNAVYSTDSVILPSQGASTKGPVSIEFVIDHPLIINEGVDSEEFQVLLRNVDAGQVAIRSKEGVFGIANYVNKSDVFLRIPSINSRILLDGTSNNNYQLTDDESNIVMACRLADTDADTVVDSFECTNEELLQFVGGKTARILIDGLKIQGTYDSENCWSCTQSNSACGSGACPEFVTYSDSDLSGNQSSAKCLEQDNVHYCTSSSCEVKNDESTNVASNNLFSINYWVCHAEENPSCTTDCTYSSVICDENIEGAEIKKPVCSLNSVCSEVENPQMVNCEYSCTESECPSPVDDMFFFEVEVHYQYCLTSDPLSLEVR